MLSQSYDGRSLLFNSEFQKLLVVFKMSVLITVAFNALSNVKSLKEIIHPLLVQIIDVHFVVIIIHSSL